MSKRRISPDYKRETPLKRSPGAPWLGARATAAAPSSPLARHAYSAAHELRGELGRQPTASELGSRLGLGTSDARRILDELACLPKLTPGMRRCLVAIATLEQRLAGSCPSTREVSAEMGLSASAARFHINKLAAVGLVTPPEVRLVLALTPWGRDLLPPEFARSAPPGGASSTPSKNPRKPPASCFSGRRSSKGGAPR